MLDECETKGLTVLWSEAAYCDMHRLAHDESLAAVGEAAEVEFAACLQGFAFHAEVTLNTGFVLRKDRKRSKKEQRKEYRGGLHFFRFGEVCLAFGLINR